MRAEEDRLFVERTTNADRSQTLAASITGIGSGFVIVLAGIAIFLVRRSSHARDQADARLRDSHLNLEATIDERTADLREANDEIQRFAYIVSHDLRSPLVNIMGFTSELEELRGDIFKRIAALSREQSAAPSAPENATDTAEPVLEGSDKQLSEDFSEALGFIKSSIGKMDRLISAILNLTREGRREFEPVWIDTRELIEGIVATVAHQAAEAQAADPDRRAAEYRQRSPCAGADLLQSDRQCAQIPQDRGPRRNHGARPHQARLCDFRDIGQWARHRSQGPSAHFRIVPPRGNPGQAGTRHRPCPCPRLGASPGRNHVGRVGTSPGQHIHDYAAYQLANR